jgi:hypothetical protein
MVVSFLVIAIYLFLFFKNGSKLIEEYNINLFYKGMIFGITLFLFSMLKFIRDGLIMDIIYIVYMVMFVVINILSNIFGKNMEIQVLFMNYPFYIKYVLLVMIMINIIVLVRTIKKDGYSENV